MFVILLIAVFILLAVISYLSFYYDKKTIDVDGPTPFPFIGNGHLLAVDSSKFIEVLATLSDTYNMNTRIYLFSKRYVITSDPTFIEEVLTSTKVIDKADTYRFMKPWLGNGLLISSGSKWKAHRKFLTPAFHFNILQNFLPIFCKNGRILTRKLRQVSDGPSFDLIPFIALAALDNVAESIMGVPVNAQEGTDTEFVNAVNDISSLICMRMRNPFIASDIVFSMLPYKTVQNNAIKVLHKKTIGVINKRREELTRNNLIGFNVESSLGTKNKYAFLDLLLLAEVDGKKLSDECIREEVDTFMFEGHDTTMSGISFCIYCISQYQDVQEKLLLEQQSIFGNDFQRDPTFSEMQLMKYLELVIKESLRLYPSVPIIGREVFQDTVICGKRIPKDTTIMINFLHMHRNSNLFEKPLDFIPERFESTTRNPFSWLPFSAGPRNCIGQKFAMLEMKTAISEIIRNFKVLPADKKPIIGADLILRSHVGVKVRLTARS